MAGGLALVALADSDRLALLLIPLWLAIATLGFIGANSAAIAMAASGSRAGSGSGLVGVLQFSCAFLVSSLVAATQNGTAYPMAMAIAGCGIAATLLWFVRSAVAKAHTEATTVGEAAARMVIKSRPAINETSDRACRHDLHHPKPYPSSY